MKSIFDADSYLTDGGFETTLLFKHGYQMPEFASFPLLLEPDKRAVMMDYYREYLDLAAQLKYGFVLETPTWRASAKWAQKLGISIPELEEFNKDGVRFVETLKDEYKDRIKDLVISGNVGPEDDGYKPTKIKSVADLENYHSQQIGWFAAAGVDVISVLTVTYVNEAIAVANAADAHGLGSVVSFTVETDGNLPSGESLDEAIEIVDSKSDSRPQHYMINCAHPIHFWDVNLRPETRERIGAIRANASKMSHEELDNSEVLDEGDPKEFGECHKVLIDEFPALKVIGGCCGTNIEHIRAVAEIALE